MMKIRSLNWSTPVWVDNDQVGYNVINNARAIRLSNGVIALAIEISPKIDLTVRRNLKAMFPSPRTKALHGISPRK
ncbi:MAG: hypothetical protein AAF135_06195 [Bacteroidota bacterium]